jgi:hypothetical protein
VGVKATVVEVLILDGLGEGGFEEEDPPLHEPNPQGWGTRPPQEKDQVKIVAGSLAMPPGPLTRIAR